MGVTRVLRRFVAVATCLVVGTSATSTATAAPPIIDPRAPTPADTEFVLAAGEACPFDVTMSVEGKGKVMFFASGKAIWVSPGMSVTYATEEQSITVPASGSFHDQPTRVGEDGTVLIDTVAVGHNVFFGSFRADDGSVSWGAYATTGRVTVTLVYDADTGEPLPALDFDASRARVTDLCAAVAP